MSIAVIGAYVFVYTVGYHPLIRWDEAIYANVAWQMVETGNWLIPQLYFHPQQPGIELQPFLEKPPLVFWLQAISIKLFNDTRFAIRLPVATLAILSGMLTYWFGKQLSDRKSGLVATTIIFTSPLIVIGSHGGRTGSTDVPLLFFGTLFVYLTWTTLTNRRSERLPLIGIAAGLALLSKGFNAGIFVIAVAPVALYYIRDFVTREGVTLIGVTAAIALPWPLYAWFRYGNEFIQQIFLTQVVGRATGNAFVTQSGTLFSFMRYPYFREFPTFFDPWVYLLFPALAAGLLYAWSQDELEKPLFLVWWATTTFVFFVITGNHGWYIMPMLVPCALIIGYAVSAADRQYKPAIFALVGGGLLMLWSTGVTLETVAVVLGIVLVVLGGFSGSSINARLTNSNPIVGYILPVMAIALLVGALVGGVPLEHEAPQYNHEEQFGQAVANEVPEGSVVGVEPLGANLWRASFYAQRPLTSAPPADLQSDLSLTYAIVSNDTLSELDRDHRILAEWQNVRLIRFSESRTTVSEESDG
ncbi:ArnT family glycosyltransferase [Halalkalicoccus subterraneus]|uniref:ArnT family glycosyltransferase n=1 Tax=Halalkalicoccus subterraneus TaxID=2675002 RepID=UPI0013CF2A92|nr:glycosyltransferase family 39 protein [Halalkalicoccus subterraneus]